MAADWAAALAPVEDRITAMGRFLREEIAAGRDYRPAGDRVFRAFRRPLGEVKVLIVGQDPYPNPDHPVGLSFAVERGVWPLPPSLVNIYTEYRDDLGVVPPRHGDLTAWSEQGVMLLNRALTVQPGNANSHRGKGWEEITAHAIQVLRERAEGGAPLVAVLWGAQAQSLQPMLGPIPVIASPHPSPLSAYRGFFGSRPFSRVNELLVERGGEPVDWTLPAE
ncbi:uracil-DNA glycosylase [Nocardioides stalactiti]|uniref:uracil-DNA glycosylase n=1 Tax=Nocardioides stalactiti TaxID=2755356 RepID=UPI001C80F538|nr:uracil-DNA glycosylase [Nocardioides stalactiti]